MGSPGPQLVVSPGTQGGGRGRRKASSTDSPAGELVPREPAIVSLQEARDSLRSVSDTCERLEYRLDRLLQSEQPSWLRAPAAVGSLSQPSVADAFATPATEATRQPARGRRGTLAVALLAGAGTLLVADAVATVTWQEPVTALLGHQRQNQLQDELAALEAATPDPAAVDPSLVGSSSRLGALPPLRATPPRQAKRDPRLRVRRLAVNARAKLEPGKAIGRIRSPRLGRSWVVAEGTDPSSLKAGPGRYSTSSLPGLPGTTAIAGHRTTYGAPFRHIDRLRTGDRITVEMPYATVEYRVEGHRVVDPSDTAALRDIGRPRLVLTACTPLYSAAQRWIVIARQVAVRPRTMS